MYFVSSLYFFKDMGVSVLFSSQPFVFSFLPPSFFFPFFFLLSLFPLSENQFSLSYMDMTQHGNSKPTTTSNNKFLGKDSGLIGQEPTLAWR